MKTGILITLAFIALHTEVIAISLIIAIILVIAVLTNKEDNKI